MPYNRNHLARKARRKRLGKTSVEPVPAYRLKLVFLILSIGVLGLISRMAWLQVYKASELMAKARAFQILKVQPLGSRRSIVDRMGKLVALDEQRFRLWAHPNNFRFPGDDLDLLRKPVEVASKLSPLLPTSTKNLVNVIGDKVSGVRLAEDLQPEIAAEIRKLGISGLELESYLQRVYPQDELLIGYGRNSSPR